MKYRSIFAILTALALVWVPAASAATYAVDKDHTAVSFKIRHLFSKVQGQFTDFDGVIEYEPGKPETWTAQGSIRTASIDTNVEGRDKHLRGADFFDVEKYPSIDFKTLKVLESSDTAAKLEGEFTMHGVTKPVTLDVEIHGVGSDPWGNVRAGFTVSTKIDRKDFGLNWNQTLETGGVLVGDEVEILLEVEGLRK